MKKEVAWFLILLVFMCGVIFGYVICDQQHENLYQEVKAAEIQLELQLLELEDDMDEIVVLEYFLDETYKDLKSLGYALERLIYTGPRGTMTLDRSMFRLSEED